MLASKSCNVPIKDRWRSLPEVIDLYQQSEFESVTYIGDGVWDGVASRQLSYQFIGIGSGDRANDLWAHGAKHVFPHYQDLEAIMSSLAGSIKNLNCL
jgi:phosphoglycolate phosphatase-like HAD superfamily hydrolase